MKIISHLLTLLLLAFSLNVFAEESPFDTLEIESLQIKLSNDGTGIIKLKSCIGCDLRMVKITAKSKASINGVEVDIQEAKNRLGKRAMVSYTPKTQEVQYIRWQQADRK